jgi:hypothetical protein
MGRKQIYLTMVFQLVVNSKDKETALLQAHKYVTKFRIRVLEAFKEDLNNVRPARAFTFVLQMLEQQAGKQRQNESISNASTLLGNLISRHFNQHYLLPEDYSFSVILREGAYRECAKMILGWCSMFISQVPLNDEDEEVVETATSQQVASQQGRTAPEARLPSVERLHALWAEWDTRYKAALATRIPFGRHRGELLKQVGKRDRRWLLEHIPAADVVKETLDALDILLGYRKVDTHEIWRRPSLWNTPGGVY